MTYSKFVEGSILRHILVMSSTSAVGISALFVVDLLDIFFLSLLGEHELAAAVGYAGSISFFTTSIGIGLSIALSALVSRSVGSRDLGLAKRLLLNSAVVTSLISIAVSILVTSFIPELTALVGASGHTAELAESYLYILIPSLPFICLAMALGGALRAVGDAKLSMLSTLAGGGVNAVLDPIFIFLFSMGIEGAALASVLYCGICDCGPWHSGKTSALRSIRFIPFCHRSKAHFCHRRSGDADQYCDPYRQCLCD